MKIKLLTILILISILSSGQQRPFGKYINDAYNELNYLILKPDLTFKYRRSVCLMHDISCGDFRIDNDTIILNYLTDLRDTCCNKDIDPVANYDSYSEGFRPEKLYYENEKLYYIDNGEVTRKVILDLKPQKRTNIHRRFFIFGKFVNKDPYYMIIESKVKWK